MNDKEIIGLYLARDASAIRETESKYGSQMFSLARKLLPTHEDAEECCSETLFRAWRHIPEHVPVVLYAYLMRLCRTVALDMLEKMNAKKRRAEIVSITKELENCLPSPETTEDGEIMKLINLFLQAEQPKNRILFVRRYFFSDTTAQIAKSMGMTEGNVRVQLHRIRSRLKAFLEKEGLSLR